MINTARFVSFQRSSDNTDLRALKNLNLFAEGEKEEILTLGLGFRISIQVNFTKILLKGLSTFIKYLLPFLYLHKSGGQCTIPIFLKQQ